MNLYERVVLPCCLDLVMRHKLASERRGALVPQAKGAVLEVGIGSGLNFPHYGAGVQAVYGIDPSERLLAMAKGRARGTAFPVELLRGTAEALPLPDASVDTALSTWTLCSVPRPVEALREIRRVLKPGGRLLFVEHGLSPDAGVAAWQRRLTPWWRRIAGGCHLDRGMGGLLREAGFDIEALDTRYIPGPRPFTYTYQGVARPSRGVSLA